MTLSLWYSLTHQSVKDQSGQFIYLHNIREINLANRERTVMSFS